MGRLQESRRDMLIGTPCRDCAVRDDALCGAVPLEELLQFNRHAHRKRFRPGSVIMTSGEQPDWYANIISGVVKLTMALPDGRQQIVGLLFPADFVGRPFKAVAPCRAEAVTVVELCCFGRRHFEHLIETQPAVRRLFMERTLDAVDEARDWMMLLGCKSAEERVATLLLLIARRRRSGRCEPCAQRQPHHHRPAALAHGHGRVSGLAHRDGQPAAQKAHRRWGD
jgi:CRP/FNR family transcriptional regulator